MNEQSSDDESTRRTFLKVTSAGVAATGFGCLPGTAVAATKNGWSTVESPTEKTLYDAVMSSEGSYAAVTVAAPAMVRDVP